MASAAQGNHPPRCAQAPSEAYVRPAGSGNRLPVLDSEAPKLPIHTAIAVPQYGPKAASGTWRRCQFGGSASADMDPSHSGISNGLRPQGLGKVRECLFHGLLMSVAGAASGGNEGARFGQTSRAHDLSTPGIRVTLSRDAYRVLPPMDGPAGSPAGTGRAGACAG